MRKIYKNINIALIFMLIGVFLCSDAFCLRVPVGDHERLEETLNPIWKISADSIEFFGENRGGLTVVKRARYKDEKGIDRECFAKWARRKDNEKGIITPQARILRFLSKMGIQGIPRVLDFVETVYGKRIILFEKFPEGGTLDEKIEALSKEEVVDIMLKVTRIVESLLAEGVYHWDIKPDNIWVTNKGEVILFDFDLAFMGKDEFTDRKLYFCGDPKFMSKRRRDIMFGPTSFLHEKVPFVPADEIFSLGRSLEVLLSERRPPDLQSLIDKACAGRYETIDEFRIDLEKVAVSMAASNKPIEMIVDAHRAGSNI